MSLLSNLFKIGGAVAAPFTGGASLALTGLGMASGAASQGMANNRGAKFSGQLDLQRILEERNRDLFNQQFSTTNQGFQNQLAAATEGRASGSDAWRKLLAAQHTLNPGARPQLAGAYNIAPRQASEAERLGAQAMSDEVMKRLQGGPSLSAPTQPTPTQAQMIVDPKLLDAGKWEKLLGVASPLLSLYGQNRPQDRVGAV